MLSRHKVKQKIKHTNQLRGKQESEKISNRTFLRELQICLREKKIKERELAKVLTELSFTSNEQELSTAYEEWANDPEEQAEIKE